MSHSTNHDSLFRVKIPESEDVAISLEFSQFAAVLRCLILQNIDSCASELQYAVQVQVSVFEYQVPVQTSVRGIIN